MGGGDGVYVGVGIAVIVSFPSRLHSSVLKDVCVLHLGHNEVNYFTSLLLIV